MDHDVTSADLNSFIKRKMNSMGRISTSAMCRSHGGYWTMGHDPSGHIFLITLMTMFILGELQFFIQDAMARLLHDFNWVTILKQCGKLFDNGLIWNYIKLDSRDRRNWMRVIYETLILPPYTFAKEAAELVVLTGRFIIWDNPIILLITLLVVWLWSFLITTLVFHTVSEQLSGLFFAYMVAGILYWKAY